MPLVYPVAPGPAHPLVAELGVLGVLLHRQPLDLCTVSHGQIFGHLSARGVLAIGCRKVAAVGTVTGWHLHHYMPSQCSPREVNSL